MTFRKLTFTGMIALGIAAVALGISVSLFRGEVRAASIFCRADPIVFLSDGTRIQFVTHVAADPRDVIELRYHLHGPAGAHILREIHPSGPLSDKETFTYYPDQRPGQYRIVTHVVTRSGSYPVMSVAKVFSPYEKSKWTTLLGLTNFNLVLDFLHLP